MRKRVWVPLVLVAAAVGACFGSAPAYLESSMNKIASAAPIAVSPRAEIVL